MANEYAADTVRSPRETPVLLTRWLRALQDAHRLRLGDARPDGFASLQWRRASSSERWLRLRILKDDASDAHALAVEFLLLAQRLLAGDAGECEQQVLSWLSDPTSLNATTLRLRQNCIGGHRFPGADADHMPLSLVMPCARHSRTWRRQDGPSDREPGAHESVTKKKQPQVRPWTLGVVVDFEGEFDGQFLTLLQKASGDPLAKDNGLSDAFRTTYLQLNHQYPSSSVASFPVRLHVRLSSLTPSAESLRSLAATLCKWHTVKRSSFSINGMDIAAPSLNELLAAAPSLPFHKLLLCASSSLASRMDPLAKTTLPMDDTTLRLLLAKAQHHLLELEVCNVKIPNFDCIVQPFATGACLLQALRLKEFAMGVVTDGGIFAALADPYHLISQSLEELEIEQALYSAGGLSFWLQREASAMLLKNARLVKCLIRQATSMHPSTVYKGDGFRETCGRKILVPVPVASKRAFIAASPIKLPRDVAERIYEFAERSTTRDAHIDYRLITQDQLFQFKRDVDVWTAHKISPYESLPYGSYYS